MLIILDIIFNKLSSICSYICFKFKNKIYSKSEKNIKLIFNNYDDKKIENITYDSLRILFLNFFYSIFGFILKYSQIHKNFKYKIPTQLYKDYKKNGIIFIGSHYGNIQNALFLGKILDLDCNLIYKSLGIVDYLLYPNNTKIKYTLIDGKDGFKKILNINKNECICLIIDRKSKNKREKINFLNQKINFHYSCIELAEQTNRKLWYVDFHYDLKNNQQQLNFINISDSFEENFTQKEKLQKVVDLLTSKIKNNPEQYFWYYDRFTDDQY